MNTLDNKKIIEDATTVQKTKDYSPETFAKAYQELCEKMGWRVVVAPSWVGTNHGSFEMVLQYTIGKITEKT